MNRTTAREALMQMFYQMEIQNDFSEKTKKSFIENNIEDYNQLEYINRVYNALTDNKEKIDALIEKYSKGWKINRIAKVDISVLRLCIAEVSYVGKESATPVGAAISEAVKISKKFGSDDSAKFINGILGNIYRNNAD